MAWLRKYPRLPGAARFVAYYVPVEVVAREARTVEYIHQERKDVAQPGGGFLSEYGPPEKRTLVDEWVRIREKGKLRWTEASNVHAEKPQR